MCYIYCEFNFEYWDYFFERKCGFVIVIYLVIFYDIFLGELK